jgi:hypothetical protein
MRCTLKLNGNSTAWLEKYKSVSRSNLLQSPTYAFAAAKHKSQHVCFYEIMIDHNQCAGIFLTQEVGLVRGLMHGIILDRGPLWLDGYGTSEHIKAFITAYAQKFPKRIGRKRRFIPEVPDIPDLTTHLAKHGFKHRGKSSYETYILDLELEPDILRANLKKNWRGVLKKAEQALSDCLWQNNLETYLWLRHVYAQDKKTKGFSGPAVRLLDELALAFMKAGDLRIGIVEEDGVKIAGILILCHGRSATYQIGWTSPAGRAKGAHNLLLWDGIRILKARGIQTFDLGGINDETAKGVKKFKAGMGGQHVILPGLYT